MKIDIRIAIESRFVIVALTGELDSLAEPALTAHLNTFIRHGLGVEISFTGLTFIDAAGARAILRAVQAAQAAGTRIIVTGASASAQRLLVLEQVEQDSDEIVYERAPIYVPHEWLEDAQPAVQHYPSFPPAPEAE